MIIEKKESDRVLELGCGKHKIFEDSVAIDKSPKSQATIVRDIARGIPFNDNEFDMIVSIEMIEHIEKYDDLIFLFNEVHRVLKHGGLFIFTTPNGVHGFEHITHHRVFTAGGFSYLKKTTGDFEDMRESDGITANFDIQWGNNTEQQLEGRFIAIKEDK